MKIVIDPGHGGADPGAVGPAGLKEKDVNLNIAVGVGQILQKHGVSTILTRQDDSRVELADRVKMANNNGADYFVSIHNNSASNPAATGTETFAFPNSVLGTKLAVAVQKSLVNEIGLADRGVKHKDFFVLKNTKMPAVLIEVAFINNPVEEKLLRDDDFLKRASIGITKGILEYLGVKYIEENLENLYRVRKSWKDVKSQVGAYKILENAITECKKHPGYKVYDGSGREVYSLSSPTEKPKEEAGTLIMGNTEAAATQMISYALKGNANPLLPHCTIGELAQIFIEEGQTEGVRADIAWAQSLKETGYFKYGGIVLPEQNNYSGIGALNNNAQGDAAIFETPRIGVRAQMQHLKAYASTEALRLQCVDPRFHLVRRGSAKYVEWLGYEDNPNKTGWAWPGKNYGYGIIKIVDAMLMEPKEMLAEDNIPKWQKDALHKLVQRKIISDSETWVNRLGETITIGEVMGILANMI